METTWGLWKVPECHSLLLGAGAYTAEFIHNDPQMDVDRTRKRVLGAQIHALHQKFQI